MADLVMPDHPAAPLRLRGHTLLCLQGFQGKGYSAEFIHNMDAIHRLLFTRSDAWVQVVDSPDAICAACPHQQPAGCGLNGERSEEELKRQDRVVLQRLGLEVGSRVRWRDILDRIAASVHGSELPSICGTCRWLPLGVCREGIEALTGGRKVNVRPEGEQ